ncbi:transglycosylase domain-containing protein [Roseiarcus sp.]|uniref:transglycosylase domain-containing protein n=1 Tax=Roseiarcus sp. TaxID=1969460 RepID=UPI003F996EDE
MTWASRALLALDAFIDSTMFAAGQRTLRILQAIDDASDRMHLSGVARVAVEVACEALTLGLAGLLVALALALPAFRETADDDRLARSDLAVTFQDRYGVEVGKRGVNRDEAVRFEELPDYFIKAVIATEDRRFFSHFGIDVIGTFRALTVDARAAGVVQGGSSITQQLAKNIFLSNERSIERKIKEAYLALWLEFHLTKKEILKLYLDRAYMGAGAFGVEAAAQTYFGKSARDIDLAEAAMLAGLFKAPTKFSPLVNLAAARARANDVLDNLVDAGFMTEGQVYAARRNLATPVDRPPHDSPDWYLDFAYSEVKALAEAGKLGSDRTLTVRTGLDSTLQTKAESAIETMLRDKAPAYRAHQAAAVIATTDGLVRAMVGGRDYGASQFNRATDAARQPGSSFKIFVYMTALLTGKYHGDTPIDASSICIGDYCVHNYHGESAGILPLYRALAESLNTAAIRMSVKIGEAYWPPKQSYHLAKIAALGRSKIVETARLMGLTTPLVDTVSLPVGADEVKMIDMLAANATLASGGIRVTPYAALEARNASGKLIYSRAADGGPQIRVLPADKVAEMNEIMTHVVTEGTGRAAQIPGLVISGKTGTTNNSTNAWFNAFTGNLVGSVWFGNDDNAPMENLTGGILPAMTWREIMAFAHQGLEPRPPFGVAAPSPAPAGPVAQAPAKAATEDSASPPVVALSPRTTRAIEDIGELARAALARLPVSVAPEAEPPGVSQERGVPRTAIGSP